MTIEEIKEKINEIENQYPYLHVDLHRDKFRTDDINKLCKLYKLLNQKKTSEDK